MRHSKLYYIAASIGLLLCIGSAEPAFAQKTKAKQKTTKKAVSKSSTTPGQYPESSERLLTDQDLEHITPWGAKVMMNEIYARHGFVFKDAALKKHFRKEKWYKAREKNLKKIRLTDTEIQNIAFIKQHQTKTKL
jgi:hypothetical protein